MNIRISQPQAIYQMGQRNNQEDTIFPKQGDATSADRLFLVCDGMGGHDKGEVASAAVCYELSRAMAPFIQKGTVVSDEMFEHALGKAFDALNAADVGHEGKMGTTMTFLCLHKGGCLVAHIGDSRIYHLRPQTGEVLYRSRDHSLVQQLYELGEISYNEMGTSPRKNIILRAMQPYQEERAKATLVHITDVRAGDYFYMCSDGMLEQMEDDELMAIVGADLSDEEKANELVRRTAENADNHSAYLLKVQAVEREADDDALLSDEAAARSRNKALHDQHKDVAWDEEPKQQTATAAAGMVPTSTPASAQRTAASTKTGKSNSMLKIIIPVAVVAALIVLALLLFGGSKAAEKIREERPKVNQQIREPNQPDDANRTEEEDVDTEQEMPDDVNGKDAIREEQPIKIDTKQ